MQNGAKFYNSKNFALLYKINAFTDETSFFTITMRICKKTKDLCTFNRFHV